MLMFKRFHNVLLVSLSKNTEPSLSWITVQYCLQMNNIITISSNAFWNFFVFLTSYHFYCIRSLHHRKYVTAFLSDQGGNVFPGLNLVILCVNYLLLVSLSWNCRGLCKQTIIEISNQCNSCFFFSFLFFKEKRKSWQGFWQCARRKQIVWDLGGWIVPSKQKSCRNV